MATSTFRPTGTPSVPSSTKTFRSDISPIRGTQKPLTRRASDFLGITEFGVRLGSELVRFTPEFRDLKRKQKAGLISQAELNNITSGGVSNKEAFGSFGLLALNLGSGGLIGSARGVGARGLTKVAARTGAVGAGFGTFDAIREDRDIGKGALTTGAITASLPIVGRGLSSAVRGTTKNLTSLLSGTPKGVIDYATKSPRFPSALREAIKKPDSISRVYVAAQKAFSKIEKQKSQKFTEGFNRIVAKNENKTVAFDNVRAQTIERMDEIGIRVKGSVLDFSGAPLDEAEERLINKMWKLLHAQKPTSIKEAQAFKLKLGGFFGANKSKAHKSVVARALNSTQDEMEILAPELNTLNKQFGESAELAKALQREFKLGQDKGSPRLAINAFKRAFKANNESSLELLQELEREGGEDIVDLLAGHFFTEIFPTNILSRIASTIIFGASGLAAPVLGAAAPLASPRIVGQGARAVGVATRTGQAVASQVGSPRSVVRQISANLGNLFGQ